MTIWFRPEGHLAIAPAPRSPGDEAFYARLSELTGTDIGHRPGVEVDYEDWMEPACLLEAALELGLETAILPWEPLRRAVGEPRVWIPGAPCRDMLVGRKMSTDGREMRFFDMGWPDRMDELASHYAELAAFRRHAGRRVTLADMYGDPALAAERDNAFGGALDSRPLGEVLLRFAGEAVLVKHVWPTKACGLVELKPEPGMSEREAEALFVEKTDLHFARFEGDRGALLVQEPVEMTCETRFFVVGAEVVAGAATIERHTPRDNAGEALRAEFERVRGGGELVQGREAELVGRRLQRFAERLAREISQEAPALRHYALDVALGSDGAPLAIEINPIANAGLYASDVRRLVAAMVREAEAAPRRKPEPWDPADLPRASDRAAALGQLLSSLDIETLRRNFDIG